MSRIVVFAGLAVALAALPGTAAAQVDCAAYGRNVAVGGWAEYTTKDAKVKLALVGSEERAGKTYYWLEMTGDVPGRGGKGVMQMLVPGFPYQADGIQEMVVKAEGQPAMKMPPMMLSRMRANSSNLASDALQGCANWTAVGEESVTVPAGTFKALHVKDAKSGDEFWVSKEVPFGLVKGSLVKNGPITLTAKGSDAKSSITETPMEMPGMPPQ